MCGLALLIGLAPRLAALGAAVNITLITVLVWGPMGAAALLRKSGQARRIFAGEAGVAALRLRIVALLAERPVEALDGNEGQAVGIDIVAHLIDVHLCREQLRPLGRI